jgi:hypothetical protein
MIDITLFNPTTGEIVSTYKVEENFAPQEGPVEGTDIALLYVASNPDTDRIENGKVVPKQIDQAAAFQRAKDEALFKANYDIGILRRSLATDIAFQQEAYYKKRAEAEAYIADPSGYPADFPLLASISMIRAMTPADLATLWITTADDLWGPILNQTEIVRERAIVAIAAATDQAGIDAALAQLEEDIATIQSQG